MAPPQRTAPAISLFVDIGEGAGLSGASGVRPFLPALLAGALARGNHGIDFGGTDFSFLESKVFLVVLLVLALALYAFDMRRREPGGGETGDRRQEIVDRAASLVGIVLGALLFAGALADHHHKNSGIGLVAGAVCAVLGYAAVAALFNRARGRLAGQGGGPLALLGVYADVLALALAAIAIVVPVVAYAGLVVFVVLIVRSRGDSAQKFQGLRILR